MNNYKSRGLAHAVGLLLLSVSACGTSSDDTSDPAAERDGDDAETDAATRGSDAAVRESSKLDAASSARHDAAPDKVESKVDAAPVDAGTSPRDAGTTSAADGSASSGTTDLKSYAGKLDGLFLDVQCAPGTPTPVANMATCQHPGTTRRVEQKVVFGGKQGTTYDVKLRVRGIWEPTSIQGGTRPLGKLPFTVGGTVATGMGDPINYQQYFIEVSEPKQTYWLNDYQYVAHDIHKEDYEAALRVAAGATVTVVMNDGNERQIANWTKDYFAGLEPYAKAPGTGQLLRLDVASVSAP